MVQLKSNPQEVNSMRIKHVLIPATLVAATTTLAFPSLAQNGMNDGWSDLGRWGDEGRSSEYYNFRDPGIDRNFERYQDSGRNWIGDRRWSRSDRRWDDSRRDMDRYSDRGDDWRSAQRESRRGYRDYDYGSAQRDSYDYGYDSDTRYRDGAYSRNGDEGRTGPFPQNRYSRDQYSQGRYSRDWRDGDRYSTRYDRDRRSAMSQQGGRYDGRYARDYDRDWRSGQGGDYTADRHDDVDFNDMNIRERAQWHERTYRGTANQGIRN